MRTDTEEFLNISELAERLRVSRTTVYAWMEAGCPHIRVGSVTRLNLAEVIAWAQERGKRSGEAA